MNLNLLRLIPKSVKYIVAVLTSTVTLWQGYEMVADRAPEASANDEVPVLVESPKNPGTKQETQPIVEEKKANNAAKVDDPIREKTPSVINYFDRSLGVDHEESVALLVCSTDGQIFNDFQEQVSDLMRAKGINSSTYLLRNSLQYYPQFQEAKKDWLSKIGLADYTSAYLIGQIHEQFSSSSTDKKISIVSVTFSGRLITLNPYGYQQIRGSSKESSYASKESIFEECYRKVAEEVTEQIYKAQGHFN